MFDSKKKVDGAIERLILAVLVAALAEVDHVQVCKPHSLVGGYPETASGNARVCRPSGTFQGRLLWSMGSREDEDTFLFSRFEGFISGRERTSLNVREGSWLQYAAQEYNSNRRWASPRPQEIKIFENR